MEQVGNVMVSKNQGDCEEVRKVGKKKHKMKKAASGKRKPISFEPLIVGQIAERQRNDILDKQIKEFEIILDSFVGNQSRIL